jgi:hypothetical protein
MLSRGPLTYLVHGQWEYSLWPTEFVGAPEHPETYASMKEWSNRLDLANDTAMYTDEKGNSCTGPASPIYIKHYPCLSFEEFTVTTGRGTIKLTSNRDVSPWALDPRGTWSGFNFVAAHARHCRTRGWQIWREGFMITGGPLRFVSRCAITTTITRGGRIEESAVRAGLSTI